MLDEMDAVFGVSALVEEERAEDRAQSYTAGHLRGLRVAHDIDSVSILPPSSIQYKSATLLDFCRNTFQTNYIVNRRISGNLIGELFASQASGRVRVTGFRPAPVEYFRSCALSTAPALVCEGKSL